MPDNKPGPADPAREDRDCRRAACRGAARLLSGLGLRYLSVSGSPPGPTASRDPDLVVVTALREPWELTDGAVIVLSLDGAISVCGPVNESTGGSAGGSGGGSGEEAPEPVCAPEITAASVGWNHGFSWALFMAPSWTAVLSTRPLPPECGGAEVLTRVPRGWRDLSAPEGETPASQEVLWEVIGAVRASLSGDRTGARAASQKTVSFRPFSGHRVPADTCPITGPLDRLPARELAREFWASESRFLGALRRENPNEPEIRHLLLARCMLLSLAGSLASGSGLIPGPFPDPPLLSRVLREPGDPWLLDISGAGYPREILSDERERLLHAWGRPMSPGLSPGLVCEALLLPKDKPDVKKRKAGKEPVEGTDLSCFRDAPSFQETLRDLSEDLAGRKGAPAPGRIFEYTTGFFAISPRIALALSGKVFSAGTLGGCDPPASGQDLPPALDGTPSPAGLPCIVAASPDPVVVLTLRGLFSLATGEYGADRRDASSPLRPRVHLVSPLVTRAWAQRHHGIYPSIPGSGTLPGLEEILPEGSDQGQFDWVVLTAGEERRQLTSLERSFLEETSGVYHAGLGEIPYLAEALLPMAAPGGLLWVTGPPGWLSSAAAGRLRKSLSCQSLRKVALFQIPDTGAGGVGQAALVVIRKAGPSGLTRYTREVLKRHGWAREADRLVPPPGPGDAVWSFVDRSALFLCRKLEGAGTPLCEYCMGDLVVKTGRESLRPVAGGAGSPGQIQEAPDRNSSGAARMVVTLSFPGVPALCDCSARVVLPAGDPYLEQFLRSQAASFYLSVKPGSASDLPAAISSLPVPVPDLFDSREKALYDTLLSPGPVGRPGMTGSPGHRAVTAPVPTPGHRPLREADHIFFVLTGLTPGEQETVARGAGARIAVRIVGVTKDPVKRRKKRKGRTQPPP